MAKLRPRFLGQARHKIFLFLFILIFIGPSFKSLPGEEGFSSFSPLPSSASINSEEENVDDFSVHPASGRHTITSNLLTDDRIVDDNLRLITVDNTSSDTTGFEMNRDLRKTDGKVEWRSKADGSGNQTEYFRDVIGNSVDFVEGQDGFTTFTGATGSLSSGDGLLKFSYSGGILRIDRDIDNETLSEKNVHHTIEIRIKMSRDAPSNRYAIKKNATVNYFLSGLVTLTEEWQLLTIPVTWTWDSNTFIFETFLSAGGFTWIDWIKIKGDLDFATHINGQIEDTWDWEETDTEGWTRVAGETATLSQVSGLFNITITGSSTTFLRLQSTTTALDTSRFSSIIVRVNASESMTMAFQSGSLGIDGAGFTIDTTMTTYTRDDEVTGDPQWTGILSDFQMVFVDSSGNFEGDEIIFIEFLLVLGEWDEVDSVIGLYDDDVTGPLLNISTHFYSNASIGARYEFELLDLSGEIAYRAFSDNFTDIGDLWVRGKITYDSLRSSLIVEIKTDNLTRILKSTFPRDFTEVSGRIPALFQLGKTPGVFFSTFTPAISWQELTIDHMRAPFKEREWTQTDFPTDSGWLEDRWDVAKVQNSTSDDSAWDLNVPYLDSVSGSLTMQFSNTTAIDDGDLCGVGFQLIGVDSDDGDEHPIYQVSVVQFRADDGGLKWFTEGAISENGSITLKDFERTAFPISENPKLSFSMSLSEDRKIASTKVRFWHNRSDLTDFFDLAAEINITTSPFQDLSQEFILRTTFTADLVADNEFTGIVEDFGFTERDIFADIVNAVVEPIGNFISAIFTAAFRFLADIFRVIGSLITIAIEIMQAGLTIALGVLQVALEVAILAMQVAIETAIVAMQTVLEAAIVAMQVALEVAIALVEAAIVALEVALEAAIGLVEAAIEALEPFLDLIVDAVDALWTLFISTLADIWDELIFVISNVISDLIDLLADVLFFWWTALGLPDLLEILNVTFTHVTDFIDWLIITISEVIQFIFDVSWIFLVGWWFFCIPVQFASENFDPFGGLSAAVEFYFMDAVPIRILGFGIYVPQGIIATAWLIIILPADFAIFTALGNL